ncbi:hypothetical protein [Streptomyces sp. NPDC001315]|uniref:hypothetical protein n=1 Tax=Streptomyces sp. NPDC001315 TaxID=3364562 RepID=UPI0036B5C41E
MSAPVSSDPLVVNTQDGSCWRQFGVNPKGRGLYGLADVKGPVPELVLWTLRELADGHGGLSSMVMDALPMPVGPEPKALREDAAEDAVRRSVDARFPKVAEFLREAVDGEHYASTHHDYRVGRDQPETGGAR